MEQLAQNGIFAHVRRRIALKHERHWIPARALVGVLASLIKWIEKEHGVRVLPDLANDGYWGNWLALGMLFLFCLYIFIEARRVKRHEPA